jgi:hypothetical protein
MCIRDIVTGKRSSFFGLMSAHISDCARNANPGSILAYPLFDRNPVTGLIGAFLVPFFRIVDL